VGVAFYDANYATFKSEQIAKSVKLLHGGLVFVYCSGLPDEQNMMCDQMKILMEEVDFTECGKRLVLLQIEPDEAEQGQHTSEEMLGWLWILAENEDSPMAKRVAWPPSTF